MLFCFTIFGNIIYVHISDLFESYFRNHLVSCINQCKGIPIGNCGNRQGDKNHPDYQDDDYNTEYYKNAYSNNQKIGAEYGKINEIIQMALDFPMRSNSS